MLYSPTKINSLISIAVSLGAIIKGVPIHIHFFACNAYNRFLYFNDKHIIPCAVIYLESFSYKVQIEFYLRKFMQAPAFCFIC